MLTSSNPSTKTRIEYDAKRGRFLLYAPKWDNGRIRGLPNRRFDKGGSRWTAPAIRGNVEAIARLFRPEELTPEAAQYIADYTSSRGRPKPNPFPAWYGFRRQPRPKQLEGLQKIHGVHAFALFMDMRTGKTKVLIDEACASRIEGIIDSMLLICPLTLRKNWVRELEKDATIPYDVHLLDTDRKKDFRRWNTTPHDFKILIVGTESFSAGSAYDCVLEYLQLRTACLGAVDESTDIKNASANRTKKIVSLRKHLKRRGILTGSVLSQTPLDLFGQFEFLDPDIIGLGDYYAFRNRYAVMGGYENKQIVGYENLDELAELVEPYVFQVRQHEVFDMDKQYVVRTVPMVGEQLGYYRTLKKLSAVIHNSGDRELIVQNILEKMLRLQEIAGGHLSLEYTEEEREDYMRRTGKKKAPRTYRQPIPGPNPKLEDLLRATDDYPGSTIVWCAFRDEIEMVARALRAKWGEDQVVELHGDIDEETRDLNVNVLFQGRKARFIVGMASVGGKGLTMSAADNIFFYSNTFNYTNREQAEERGTEANGSVLVVDFVCENSVDEICLAANDEKKDMQEFVRSKIDEIKRLIEG